MYPGFIFYFKSTPFRLSTLCSLLLKKKCVHGLRLATAP